MVGFIFSAVLRDVFASIVMVCLGVGVASADPRGLWLAGDGAHVSIASCGSELCGVLASTATATDPATGRPWTDKNNIDQRLQERPLVGVHVLIGMRAAGEAKWSGHVYNTDDGKTYSGSLTELDARTVRVEGCVALLCGGENMIRIK